MSLLLKNKTKLLTLAAAGLLFAAGCADEGTETEQEGTEETTEETAQETTEETTEETSEETTEEGTEDGSTEDTGSSGSFTPGTYEGTAEGHSGDDITATVTVNEEEVESVEFEHSDTPDFADDAAEEVSSAVEESNSSDVEPVSGATVSSEAMIEAVDEALSQASE